MLRENEVQEIGWAGLGLADTDDTGIPHLDWSKHVISGFGAYVPELGVYEGTSLPPVEVTDEDIQTSGFGGGFRTPVLEVDPQAFRALQKNGELPHGSLALGDDGTIYQYDGMDGFFKKLFKKVKKGIKKIRGKIRKGIRKLLKRTKFGRIILKVRDKVVGTMMKIVKPLTKFVGKWAGKLAPIAAIIPGYGTAIAGALAAAGKIANVMNKYGGVIRDVVSPGDDKGGKEVKHKKLFFKTPAHEKAFHASLKKEAEEMRRRPKTELLALNAKLKAMPVEKYSRPTSVDDAKAEHMVQVMRRARGRRRVAA